MEQLSLFALSRQELQDRPELLPGFTNIIEHLKEIGRPFGWVTKVVDPSDPFATFVKAGKPWYKSDCPHYEGFWLGGFIGSVQCRACEKLLPGCQWDVACKGDFQACPFYKEDQHEHRPEE